MKQEHLYYFSKTGTNIYSFMKTRKEYLLVYYFTGQIHVYYFTGQILVYAFSETSTSELGVKWWSVLGCVVTWCGSISGCFTCSTFCSVRPFLDTFFTICNYLLATFFLMTLWPRHGIKTVFIYLSLYISYICLLK